MKLKLDSPKHSLFQRLGAAVKRRIGFVCFKVRFPQIKVQGLCEIHRGLNVNIYGKHNIVFGKGCSIGRHMTLESSGDITIGENTVFGHYCTIAARRSIKIGKNCLIAEMVSIRDHDHSFDIIEKPILQQGENVSPVTIGENVWIGAKTTIIKGVTIGDNAVIGANAVVTRNVPNNAVAAGVPARVLRIRS